MKALTVPESPYPVKPLLAIIDPSSRLVYKSIEPRTRVQAL